MNALTLFVGVLFALACGASGGVAFLFRARAQQQSAHNERDLPARRASAHCRKTW